MNQLRILLADPDDHTRLQMQLWIEECGHQVIPARAGNEAIALLKTSQFDVVITEVLLPDGDGLDVIRFSRQTRLSHRIIAISGGGSYLTRLDCLKLAKLLGAHAVALKPMVKDQLLSAIEARPAAAASVLAPAAEVLAAGPQV